MEEEEEWEGEEREIKRRSQRNEEEETDKLGGKNRNVHANNWYRNEGIGERNEEETREK